MLRELDVMVLERRLAPILEYAVEGDPDYCYGVIDGFSGALWRELFATKGEADKAAADLEGRVVIVAARILEDAEGDIIEPAN